MYGGGVKIPEGADLIVRRPYHDKRWAHLPWTLPPPPPGDAGDGYLEAGDDCKEIDTQAVFRHGVVEPKALMIKRRYKLVRKKLSKECCHSWSAPVSKEPSYIDTVYRSQSVDQLDDVGTHRSSDRSSQSRGRSGGAATTGQNYWSTKQKPNDYPHLSHQPPTPSQEQNLRVLSLKGKHGGASRVKRAYVRPWKEKQATVAPRSGKDVQLKLHYGTYRPNDTYVTIKPLPPVHDHQDGPCYNVRYSNGRPLQMEPEEWDLANQFKDWTEEKQKEISLHMTFKRNEIPAPLQPKPPDSTSKKVWQPLTSVALSSSLSESVLGSARDELHVSKDTARLDFSRSINEDPVHSHFSHLYSKESPVRDEQMKAVIDAQRWARGFLARQRMRRLKQRVVTRHTGDFSLFLREYKGLVTRIQRRYEIEQIQHPFNVDDVNEFLDRKEKYEKTYQGMAVGAKLSRYMLKRYFNACGLTPSEREINVAFQAIFKGCESKADVIFVVDCSRGMRESSLRIKTELVRELVGSLHVSEDHVRVGFVPFNTDLHEPFGLEEYGNREDAIKDIENVGSGKDILKTDAALAKMRELFTVARLDVQKTCIMITGDASSSDPDARNEAMLALDEDINIIGIGVGDLPQMGVEDPRVFYITRYIDLPKVKAEILNAANLANCEYCDTVIPTDLMENTKRGLMLEEALELVWMIFPPRATGLDPIHRPEWMKNVEEPTINENNLLDGRETAPGIRCSSSKSPMEERLGLNLSKPRMSIALQSWDFAINETISYINRDRRKSNVRALLQEIPEHLPSLTQTKSGQFLEP